MGSRVGRGGAKGREWPPPSSPITQEEFQDRMRYLRTRPGYLKDMKTIVYNFNELCNNQGAEELVMPFLEFALSMRFDDADYPVYHCRRLGGAIWVIPY